MNSDGFDALVAFLTPDMAEKVRTEHIADAHGDCVKCSGYRSVRWPCVHYQAAARAVRK